MANENEHVAKLVAARSRMVTERREVASALTEKYKRSHTDNMRELLVQIQATIEAIDRAIADEKNMASAPVRPGVEIKITEQ
jgi:antitoxin (DNA-binding transcriptional repressor) of toxin-antitoxin stability system